MIYFHRPYGQYWWLANFAPIRILFEGKEWPTVEHAFQAAKFAPHQVLMARIARCSTPGKAKATAKKLATLKRQDWNDIHVTVMYVLTKAKFEQHTYLRKRLIETGMQDIIEATYEDDFWGANANGHGQNIMGKILMQVRGEIHRKRSARSVKF